VTFVSQYAVSSLGIITMSRRIGRYDDQPTFSVGDQVVINDNRGFRYAGHVRRIVKVSEGFPAPYELEGDFDGVQTNFGPEDLDLATDDDVQTAKAAGKLYKVSNAVIGIPEYWTTTSGMSMIPDPSKLPLMQEMMNSTWEVKYTRDRGKSKIPIGARVTNVLRVENHESFRNYCDYAMALRSRRGCCHRQMDWGAETLSTVHKYEKHLPPLDRDIQEVYLFHGTNPMAAESIATTDFDMSRAGSAVGSMFGPGVYCAENASKSDEYAQDGTGIYAGQHATLLCRVCAGNICTVTHPGDYSDLVLSGEYDSICGDRRRAVGTFREFIFFDNAAVYPEFIILYQRIYQEPEELGWPVCHNGCGRDPFRKYSTCCTRCRGPAGPHSRDCNSREADSAPRKAIKHVFYKAKDSPGGISIASFRLLLEPLFDEDDLESIVRVVDKNDNGIIEVDEFVDWMWSGEFSEDDLAEFAKLG
jgi:hypothetical protein